MPTPIDQLNPGDWIAICGYRGHQCRRPFDGMPYRIKAICLPFLALHDRERNPATVDVRVIDVVKLSAAYVRALYPPDSEPGESGKPEEPDSFRCVRCGEQLRQTFTKRAGWRVKCPGCGSDFGPVDAETK
jgi:DNA-directed RNA polymerase subunit RPC12/RpoP